MAFTNPEFSLNKTEKINFCNVMLIYIGGLHFVLRKFMFYYENTLLQASKHLREHVSHLLFCIVGRIIMVPFVVK